MANEIKVSASLSMQKGEVEVSMALGPLKVDMTGDDVIEFTQNVFTNATGISIGAASTAGWALIKNLDATNFITLRNGSGGADLIKLKPGEFCLFRLATQTPFGVADTATCKIHCIVIED